MAFFLFLNIIFSAHCWHAEHPIPQLWYSSQHSCLFFLPPCEYMHGILALLLCECIAHVCSRRSCRLPSLPVHLVENKKPVFLQVRRDSGISFLACLSMGTSPYFWQDLTGRSTALCVGLWHLIPGIFVSLVIR